ncbi:response regulator [Microvirga sp. VF16]|uniref:response regulator n=1 Tax=Microvirga sp. VF16 TaxID=2807101 RepID=UPI00193D491E|nr:response regulator [Microvirga sp. VF16]QRM33770.1 response regulator [Microvirga sp. VF16]
MTAHNVVTKTTVLLVENEPVVRTGIATVLNEAGFNVIEANSIPEAWTTLEARPGVQVLFADLDVSTEAEGLDLARKVHDRWPSIGLVMTSGHLRHLRPADVPGEGCFLPRPFPKEILLREIRAAAHQ